jgi:hypothetical protein
MIAREGERPVKKLGILTLIVLANGCASTRPEAIRSPLAIADPRAGQENNAGSGIDADIADAVVGGGVTGEAQTLNRIADETVRLANAVVQETVRPETPPEASKANGELPKPPGAVESPDGKSELPGSEPVVRAEPIPAPLLGEPTTDAPARSGDTVVLDSVIDSV